MPNTKSLTSVSRSQKAKPKATLYWGFTLTGKTKEGEVTEIYEDAESVQYDAVYEFHCSETSKMPSALTKIFKRQESAFGKKGPEWMEYSGHELVKRYNFESAQVLESIKGFETELQKHVDLTTTKVGTSDWPGGSKAWVLLHLTKKRAYKTDNWKTDEWKTAHAFGPKSSSGSNTSNYGERNLS